ncbi:MAG: hemolysin III family protein, partial [Patescibacteria group bacterium]
MRSLKRNEPLSSLTHLIGAVLSVMALVLMIIYASWHGSAIHVVGFTIFGASLVILYTTSTLYHFFPQQTKVKKIFHRLDHAMIYFLIAGTYTPITLIMPQRVWGWSIFGIVWGIAVAGMILKGFGIKMTGWLSVVMYIIMGWLIVVAIHPLAQWLTPSAIKWLFAGGVMYTVGCLFYALDKY